MGSNMQTIKHGKKVLSKTERNKYTTKEDKLRRSELRRNQSKMVMVIDLATGHRGMERVDAVHPAR